MPAVVRAVLPIVRPVRDLLQILFRIPAVRRQARSVIAKERPDLVVATSDDGVFLVAAYQAARTTNTPLCLLLFDIYARNNYSWVKRLFARFYEPRILRDARVLIVMNEATRAHYQRLYGVDAVILGHPAPRTFPTHARPASDPAVIAYTGSIYWAQRDAIRIMVRALSQLPSVRLHVVSDFSERELRELGVWGAQVTASYSEVSGARAWQTAADILYLPLAFRTGARDVIHTAAPGKMAEYLVSGVPILVHAPAHSYIARDARQEQWGLVVDRAELDPLVAAVRSLLQDDQLRQRLVSNAFAIAEQRHDEARIAENFRRHLGFAR